MEEAIDNFKTAASLLDHNDDESSTLEHLQTLLTSLESIQHSDSSSNHEFNEEFDEEQDDNTLVTDLIRTSMSSYNNKQEKVSFRTLLASSDLSKELFECMSHRLEPQEEEQNDISSHWTVSKIAMISARVYLELSRMGGSWGVGWIDVGIIRTCEALVRRFGEEARGKVLDFVEKKNQKRQPSKRKMTATNKIKRGRVRESDGDDEDSEQNDDDYDEHGFDEVPEYEEIKSSSSPTDSIMMHGLYLMATIGNVLKGNEFWNWNKDARDGILDAAVLALGISSALSLQQSGSKAQPETLQCSDSLNHLSSGIEVCLVNRVQATSTDEGNTTTEVDESGDVAVIQDNDKSSVCTTACPKDALVTVLRGSYAILTYSVDLPNGAKGKASAFQSITTLTTNVLRELAKSARRKNRLSLVSFATTPCQNTRTSMSATPCLNTNNPSSTRKTPRSHRKSLDGKLNIPPSLKKTFTPNFRRSIGPSQIKQSRSMIDIFLGLMQKLCVSKGMEKADVRLRISSFIESCLEELPYAQRSTFLAFVGHLCRSKISAHRLFGVELSGNCLLMSWLWDSVGSKPFDSIQKSTPESEFPINADVSGYIADDNSVTSSLLSALHGRLSDKAPAVRARAAVALSTTLKEIHRNGKKETQTRLLQSISNFRIPLLTTLRKRACVDEKATVRRACIIALVEILLFDANPNDEENVSIPDIKALSQLCNDPSVSVRKVAIECIIELIFNDQNKFGKRREITIALETAWADSVLPLIYDTENSCSTKVVDSFETLIIDPIISTVSVSKRYDQASEMDSGLVSAWNILSRINTSSSSTGSFKGGKNALSVALRKLFETLEAQAQRRICMGLLKELHIAILEETESYTQTESLTPRLIGAWCLLETLTSMESKRSTNKTGGDLNLKEAIKRSAIGTDFLVKCWDTISSWFLHSISSNYLKVPMVSIAKSSLTVISEFAPIMSTEEAEDLFHSFSKSLRSFSIGLDIIGSTIAALGNVCLRIHEKEGRQQISKEYDIWMNDLYRDCENALSMFFIRNGSQSSNIEQALYTIGELAMLGFNPGNETYNESLSAIRAAKEANANKDESVISNLRVLPSSRLTQLVQALLLPTLPVEGGSTESGTTVPSKIRALAFITFGKICLRDEAIAKGSINIFARELSLDAAVSDSAVKSNALIVLGDFCVRYTHHVDKFLPLMASCLQPSGGVSIVSSKATASSVIVRHHAILILSNLLLQDYIKWKGVLFYRFLAATVDEDATVANLAKLLLCGPLLTKQPKLFFNNFVDSLFILNGCTAHPMYTSRNNKDAFSYNDDSLHLFNVDSSIKRNDIYCLLLSHMSDEEKIGITARLSKEVLSAATELTGELRGAAISNGHESRSNAYSVLSDCFEILTSPEMTISKGVQDADEEKDTTLPAAPGPMEAQMSSAKGKLLSKISRKQLIESVLPILCNLKVIFEQSRSPLLRNLMQYLVCIFRQYKKEVNETLVSNQTLLQEIKYDTKKFEKNSKHFTDYGAENELEYRVISAVVSQDATDAGPIVG